jgi:hypothetical protein
MLIEFSVSNFLSFKEKVTFSMVATKLKELPGCLINVNENMRLLKSAVLYGANASGKSNFLRALGFMCRFVLMHSGGKIPVERFLFSSECDDKPSLFEAVFLIDGVKYVYGFSVDTEIIHEEWLHSYEKGRQRTLFERSNNIIKLSEYFYEGKGLGERIQSDSLFFSKLAASDGEIAFKISQWFRHFSFIDVKFAPNNFRILDSRDFKNFQLKIMEFINIADLQIEGISEKEKIKGTTFLKTSHLKYDENNNVIGHVDINLSSESTGTQRIILEIVEPLIDALSNGKILVIDELDTSLHPLITHKIIELFNSSDNKNNAQLIITTHDTNLLDEELFRRDQIWFTEKDRYGRSDLYSLVAFKVRKDASYEKSYLMGKYGAIPFVGSSSHLFDDESEK